MTVPATVRFYSLCPSLTSPWGAAVPGDVPAVSQRGPQHLLLGPGGLAEQLQGPLCQKRGDHRGWHVRLVKRDHLQKEREHKFKCSQRYAFTKPAGERELTMARPSKSMWTKSAGLGLDRTPSS